MGDKKVKAWEDSPSTATPITAAELTRMETRNKDLRWNCPASWTSIDEFDDDSLDGAWTRVDPSGASSRMDVTEGDDGLHVRNNGSDSSAQLHALVRPLSPFGGSMAVGDAIVTAFTLFARSANYHMCGVILSDGTTHGSGTQVAGISYAQFGDGTRCDSWSFTGFNSGTGDTGLIGPASAGGLFYVRLVKLASNVWRTDFSNNGRLWIHGPGTLTLSFTPTHVGILSSSWGTTTQGITSYEFLRRVSGVS